jgi:acetolactate synthase-1/2/3 large subunit
VHASQDARTVAADGARAVQAARTAPGQIATLILPADTAWLEAEGPAEPLPVAPPPAPGEAAVRRALEALKAGGPRTGVLMRGAALTRAALEDAGRIAAATGCRLFCDTFAPRLERGAGVVEVERIPYFAEQIVDFFKDFEALVLVGAKPPTAFFAYPDKPSWCLPDACQLVYLAHEHEDGPAGLAQLADALGAPKEPPRRAPLALPGAAAAKFNAFTIGQAIARHLPEGAVLSDDGATSSAATLAATAHARPHVHLPLTGGAIGQGLPVAAGAAVACPDRKVVCITGDGSGLYMPQTLWTMARERLDVTTVVFANRAYKILGVELGRVGAGEPGEKAKSMLELRDPVVDWVALANSFGVEASRAEDAAAFEAQFADAMAGRGPRLIEAVIG